MWSSFPKPIFCLAPMAGITDSSFRMICKECGADLVYSEMASVAALFFKPQKTLTLLSFSLKETPYVVQLFGKEPAYFEKATQIISKGLPILDYEARKEIRVGTAPPWGIDINFGCPAKKVYGHGSGAALMNHPRLAKEIILAVTKNTPLPVSIKLRTAVKETSLLEFLKEIQIEKLGVSAIMIHGRTFNQGFDGPLDYETIRKVKQIFSGTIIGNGGIKKTADAEKMLQLTGAHGVGIARGAYGNPWIFQKLQKLKKNKNKLFSSEEKKALILKQALYSYKLKGPHGIIEFRKHLLWYLKGFRNLKYWRPLIVKIETPRDVEKILIGLCE